MRIVVREGVPYVRPINGETLDDCDPRQTVALLRRYGHVVYRGFAPGHAGFCEFTERFGQCADLPAGRPSPFHPYQPDAIWSLRRVPDRPADPEQVVDGVRLFATMSAHWAAFARGNGVRFDRLRSRDACRAALRGHSRAAIEQRLARLQGLRYEFRADGSLFTSFVAPLVCRTPAGADTIGQAALRAVLEPELSDLRLADGRPMPDRLAEHLRDVAGIVCRTVGAAVGDLTVLDNHRTLRRAGTRDLAVRQCDNVLGSFPPRAVSLLDAAVKRLLQSESGASHMCAVPA